ncbi:OmpA family protein [Methylophaga thiooxydans]|uniref:OmpA family protein n=1 Tax=Methylophaga thiooxydans TaxID=392484 RepID=UPI002357888E|nr:OmpA family protein [Methylophaga thiooxydans]
MLINFFFALFFALPVSAEQFQAPVTDTQWQVIESPLECSLMQSIPGFGEAGFYRRNGGALSLSFISQSHAARQNNVLFQIAEAPWQNKEQRQTLTSQPTERGQTRFSLNGVLAQQALSQMQEGRFPVIEYPSQSYSDNVTVMLSTVKFNDSFASFQQCLSQLHPDTFGEVNKLTVYFEIEQATLTPVAKKALTRLAGYVKVDDSINQIKIASHTDNHGRRRLNEPLSDARALSIKRFLITEFEIPEQLISINSYVEAKPTASNKTPLGRAKNRRAEITLVR